MNVTIVFIVLYNMLSSLESRSEDYDSVDVLNNHDFILVPRAILPDVREETLKSSGYIENPENETTHLNGDSVRRRRSSHNQKNMFYLPKPLEHNHQILITGEKKDNNSISIVFHNGDITIAEIPSLVIPETKFTLRFLILRHQNNEHGIQVFHQDSHLERVEVENISDVVSLTVSNNVVVESLTFIFNNNN